MSALWHNLHSYPHPVAGKNGLQGAKGKGLGLGRPLLRSRIVPSTGLAGRFGSMHN